MLIYFVVFLFLLSIPLFAISTAYTRILKMNIKAEKLWGNIEKYRYKRHQVISDLLNMSHVPLQHAWEELTVMAKSLETAQNAAGVVTILDAEVALTDAIVDLENAIEIRPPRFDGERILKQVYMIDNIDNKLDEVGILYNKTISSLNLFLSRFWGRAVRKIFHVHSPLYFHYESKDANGDLPQNDDKGVIKAIRQVKQTDSSDI